MRWSLVVRAFTTMLRCLSSAYLPIQARPSAASSPSRKGSSWPFALGRWALSASDALFEPVASIEAVDERHVRFTLEEPYAPLLSAVSIFAASVVHRDSYEADPERFGIEPICSGAFKVEESR